MSATIPESVRKIILSHAGSPTKAQRACMAAGHRLSISAIRNVMSKATKEPK